MKIGLFYGQNAVDQNSYDGWAGLLNGCVNDARDMAISFANMGYTTECRLSGWNVAGKSMPWVMSGQATMKAFRDAHAVFQKDARRGDTFVIGNSGHGGQYDTPWQFNGGETLCFYDGQIYDSELHDLMCRWPAGVNVVYFMDSCHSGGLDRDREFYTPKSAPLWVGKMGGSRARMEIKSTDIQANILQFCACRAEETAADGRHNGAFTGALLEIWKRWGCSLAPLTWDLWFKGTAQLMEQAFPNQHPVLNVLGGGNELLVQSV